MLTDGEIKLFQNLHKKHFGEDISQKEALVLGVKLVSLLQVIDKNMKINIKKYDSRTRSRMD